MQIWNALTILLEQIFSRYNSGSCALCFQRFFSLLPPDRIIIKGEGGVKIFTNCVTCAEVKFQSYLWKLLQSDQILKNPAKLSEFRSNFTYLISIFSFTIKSSWKMLVCFFLKKNTVEAYSINLKLNMMEKKCLVKVILSYIQATYWRAE